MELRLRMQRLSQRDKYPFHMPGHKNLFSSVFGDFDPTELPGLDNLHDPQSILKRVQKRIADIYQVAGTYFLVNGSSVGIMAALASVLRPGDAVLVPRSCHKAVLSGLIHSGAMPIWIEQDFCPDQKNWLPPSVEHFSKELAAHSIRAAILTTPDYFGFAPDIFAIAQLCQKAGIPLIADEAHGAHLKFGTNLRLPRSAVDSVCDIIVQSPHKTLPALTQSAWVHLNNKSLTEQFQDTLNLFHTTSPSYLLLSSLEYAGIFAQSRAAVLLRRLYLLVRVLELQSRQLNLQVWTGACSRDWTKFTIPNRIGLVKLLHKAGIFPELVQKDKVLFMLTLADAVSPGGIEALYDILPDIACLPEEQGLSLPPLPALVQECPPREAWLQKGIKLPLEQAVGRISRQTVAPYPPGTVVVAPGQRLNSAIVDYLLELSAGKVISKWIEVI